MDRKPLVTHGRHASGHKWKVHRWSHMEGKPVVTRGTHTGSHAWNAYTDTIQDLLRGDLERSLLGSRWGNLCCMPLPMLTCLMAVIPNVNISMDQ